MPIHNMLRSFNLQANFSFPFFSPCTKYRKLDVWVGSFRRLL